MGLHGIPLKKRNLPGAITRLRPPGYGGQAPTLIQMEREPAFLRILTQPLPQAGGIGYFFGSAGLIAYDFRPMAG